MRRRTWERNRKRRRRERQSRQTGRQRGRKRQRSGLVHYPNRAFEQRHDQRGRERSRSSVVRESRWTSYSERERDRQREAERKRDIYQVVLLGSCSTNTPSLSSFGFLASPSLGFSFPFSFLASSTCLFFFVLPCSSACLFASASLWTRCWSDLCPSLVSVLNLSFFLLLFPSPVSYLIFSCLFKLRFLLCSSLFECLSICFCFCMNTLLIGA